MNTRTMPNSPKPRTRPITGSSPRQSQTRHAWGALSSAYRALPMTQKGGWQTIANTLNDRQNRTGQRRLSPGNVFVRLNTARLSCGWPVLHEAPADIAATPLLPPVSVETTHANDAFRLTLTSAPYPHAVGIWASAPTPANKETFPDSAFQFLGSLSDLENNKATNITALYQALYGTPETGAQIALKLAPITPAGVRGPSVLVVGIVQTETVIAEKEAAPSRTVRARNPARLQMLVHDRIRRVPLHMPVHQRHIRPARVTHRHVISSLRTVPQDAVIRPIFVGRQRRSFFAQFHHRRRRIKLRQDTPLMWLRRTVDFRAIIHRIRVPARLPNHIIGADIHLRVLHIRVKRAEFGIKERRFRRRNGIIGELL